MTSVRELVSQSDIGLSLLTSGSADLDIEMTLTGPLEEILPLATKGTLLAVTKNPATPWRDAVATAVKVRASALAISSADLNTPAGVDLVAAAGDYRIALIEVPIHTPFPAITDAISQLQRTDSLRQAREALLAQRRILDLAFEGSGVAGIVATVASLTGRQVALVDADGGEIAGTAGFQRDLKRGAETSQRLSVGVNRELIVMGPPLNPEGLAVLTSAAIVLSVEERMSSHNTVLERERWGRVTRAILTGDGDPLSLAQVLDPEAVLPGEIHVVVVQGSAEDIASWRSLPRAGGERFITRYPLGDAEQPSTASGIAVAWQVISPDLLPRALNSISQWGLDVAVGIPTPLDEASVSRRSAEALLHRFSPAQQLYQHPRTAKVLYATNEGPIMSLLAATPTHTAISRSVLGQLSHSHPNIDTELRETLRVFLAHHGGRAPTAEALGIHRNTLRTRLTRIEEILGKSLDNADDRAELWLALRVD